MIVLRLLAFTLACACAGGVLTAAGAGDEDCALFLSAGRSSAYDYSLNLLRGNFAYNGQPNCITYEAVNQAYLEARNRILVSQPKGDWKAEDFASVGELVLDISINLAKRYGLTYEEIEKGLPLIDTSRTLIREVCPPIFSHVECRPGKYRRLDGLCNNLQNPTWGSTMAPFQRLIGPLFADGINAPRIAHTGRDLPLSRVVSRTMHPDDGFHDHAGTVMVIAWGQFMDHDYTLTGTPLDPINRNDPEECCKRPPHLKHPYCNEIRVPDDDYFYKLFGVKCIDFVRGFPSPRPGCRLGSRVPFNTLTGVIDGNTVYGVTDKFARKLRTGYGGLLRMNPVFKEYGLRDLLPLKLDVPDEGCTRPNKNMYCFEAGEIRVNEQLVLTVMHTLMAREHNRVAEALAAVNPHWDDETLYQEARRINIAEIQHITYNEFLPILLGKDVMEKFGLVLEKEGYWDGYDPKVNPDVLDSFAAAAYRFGHSLLPTAIERWSKAHKFIASKRLSDLIRRPYDLYRAGVMDEYIMGLMNQVAQAMDDSITQEVTNHLFKKVGARFGMDLVSFNMQRGREFGLPGYMEFRKFCGLPDAHGFEDLFGSMPNETVHKYQSIFEHPIDIDLWSGGVSEKPLPGSMLGPTFACIISTQFSYSRRGDRFWFELPNQPSSFTPEQLHEIRKSRMARIICDNTDIIDTVQLYPMVLPDHELNPRVPCKSGIIPSMDFSKWAEPAPFHGGPAKDFITVALPHYDSNINETNNATTYLHQNNNAENISLNVDHKSNITSVTNNEESITKNNKNNAHNETNNFTTTKAQQTDVLHKYVSKGKHQNSKKNTGHYKNSISRRKRSLLTNQRIENTQQRPLIVDYQTTHPVQYNILPGIPFSKVANNFANFNIETRHDPLHKDNIHKADESEKPEVASNDRNEKSRYDVEKSSESEDRDINSSASKEDSSQESNEKHKNSIKSPDANEQSEEYYKDKTERPKDKIKDNYSNEDNDQNNFEDKIEDNSKKQHERSKGNEDNKSNEYVSENFKNPSAVETIDKNDFNYKKNIFLNNDEVSVPQWKPSSIENSDDRDEEKSKSVQIKDVDLDDFSYERIHINDKGNVESAKDSHNEEEKENTSVLDSSGQEPDSAKKEDYSSESVENGSSKEQKPIELNDNAIKPVVELNSENDNSESEEENSKSSLNLEAPLETNEPSSKFKDDESKQNNEQVKQDFERIPLNYKHDDSKKETPKDDNSDKFNLPRYDENLKIKFDDVSITLPEIKLPEDILSYADEDSPNHKNRFYHYEDDDYSSEKPTRHNHYKQSPKRNKNADEEDKGHNYYYGPSDNERYTNKPKNKEEDEEEDLYEKFVRERFGKRGTFGQRSEKVQRFDYPELQHTELSKNVQKVLHKTARLEKEAKKSGDPNAGYMWTLEYGKRL